MNKKIFLLALACLSGANVFAQDAKDTPEKTEFYQPVPPIVTPGTDLAGGGFTAPSDAIVLFDGTDMNAWVSTKGGFPGWDVHDGVMTVNKKAGDIKTKQQFSNFQLHLEWQVPTYITGKGQSRGNSGVFLQELYEIQILDSYKNETYHNGQAASIYNQSVPLVNATRKPGEWNVYDIIYTAPTFKEDGTFRTPPVVTVLHNGVLVQNHQRIKGTTYSPDFFSEVREHGDASIVLQSHGDPSEPISFRNIWIREM